MLAAAKPLTEPGWHLLGAVLDGTETKLYVDGMLAAHGQMLLASVAPELRLAPVVTPLISAADNDHPRPYELPFEHFGGSVAGVELFLLSDMMKLRILDLRRTGLLMQLSY